MIGVATAIAVLVGSATICAVLVWRLQDLLKHYALAQPNARSSHRVPTPQGGGIAVIAATLAVSGSALLIGSTATAVWPLFVATVFLTAVGAWDDIHTTPAALRLALQALAIGFVVAMLPADLRVLSFLPFGLERVLLLVAGLWFVNLVNFMDGIDWMMVAEIVPVATGLVLLGMAGALPQYCVLIALALAGAMVGFAPFNRPVAKIFLGDVGSLPVGLLTGWLLLVLAANGHLAAALLLPLYFITDATVTLLRRIVSGKVPWHAHRDHFYQRAVDGKFSTLQIVAHVFAVNLALVVLALLTVLISSLAASLTALFAGCGLVAWLLYRFESGAHAG